MALTPEQQQQLEYAKALSDLELEKEAIRRAAVNADEAARVAAFTAAETARKEEEAARAADAHVKSLEVLQKQLENQTILSDKQAKLEAVRLARETLLENRRSLPVGEREITAADITAFADNILAYINNK